jgi:predicted CopG family antitoxin
MSGSPIFINYAESKISKMSAYKCIRISKDTYRNLTRLGTLGDTFDSVIARLVQSTKEGEKTVEKQRSC